MAGSHDKYFPTGAVSRYLPPGNRSFTTVVFRAGKPVTDAALQLQQDVRDELRRRIACNTTPSGFVRGVTNRDSFLDYIFPPAYTGTPPVLNPDFTADAFQIRRQEVMIAGFPLTVEFANTDTENRNLVQLDSPPVIGGAPPDVKRTDFVFLEAWFTLIEDSPNGIGSFRVQSPLAVVALDTVTIDTTATGGGVVVLTAVAGAPGVNQFMIGVDAIATAINLAAAINLYVTGATARVNPTGTGIVELISSISGVVGNGITIATSNTLGITISGGGAGPNPLTGGADTANKPDEDSIYVHGNVQSSTAVAVPDDLEDPNFPILNLQSTYRIQLQYRIRHTGQSHGVDFKLQADGFSNPTIFAQGTQGAPVATYNFVPADNASVVGSSDATAYGFVDGGLYVAGDGSSASATALGTLDGFVYAMPIAMVFRRNDATLAGGWNPATNTNGALLHDHLGGFVNPNVYSAIGAGESDRPDGGFADEIRATDILDLRRHVILSGIDLSAEVEFQMKALLDGKNLTWAIDTASKQVMGSGSGDVSTQFLVCDEIGRTAASGGVPPLSGDTTRGETIRNFDHVVRRFGAQPVVERIVFVFNPGDTVGANPGKFVTRAGYAAAFTGWAEDDEITLDLSALDASTLGDFDLLGSSFPAGLVSSLWPVGTQITNVLSVYHDDGDYAALVDQTVKPKLIQGMGTDVLTISLDANGTQVNGGLPGPLHDMVGTLANGDVGSPRPIFVEVEISYPAGSGLTNTPDLEVLQSQGPYPFGPLLENDISLGQRPPDMEFPLAPGFRPGFRETSLEYVANDPDAGVGHPGAPIGSVGTVEIVSRDDATVLTPRRLFGSNVKQIGVSDVAVATPKTVDQATTEYGSSSRTIRLKTTGPAPDTPLSGAGHTLTAVTYFAQDPVPNYGGAGLGYQVCVYYRSNAPQTTGTKEGIIAEATGASFPYIGITGPLPATMPVEPLAVSPHVWTGQIGMGNVGEAFPYLAPLDQIPVNDGRTQPVPPPASELFDGEWFFIATAETSIADFTADTGLLALHALLPVDNNETFTFGGVAADRKPDKDSEFRAYFPFADLDTYRPTVMAQPMSAIVRHKAFTPVLCRATEDSVLFRKGELLLLVLTRWCRCNEDNTVVFADEDNRSCVGIYRTKNLYVVAGDPHAT